MLNKLLKYKKIAIVAILFFLVLCISIFILVTSETKKTDGKDEDTKTEQSYENGNSTLEVLQPDEDTPEDSSNASGSWGDTPQSNPQSGDTGNKTDKTESEKSDEEDKKDDGEESEKDEDENILEDDISWGNIY